MNINWHIKNVLVKTAIKLLDISGFYKGYWNYWRGGLFNFCEKKGFHILPVHFYTPIPDTENLPLTIWDNKTEITGISLNEDTAIRFLSELSLKYYSEWEGFPLKATKNEHQFYLNNSGYGSGDAEILYGMIRHLKPKRIIEIGSGNTTLLISEALAKNSEEQADYYCNFKAIEPYPPKYLKRLPTNVTELIVEQLQDISLQTFDSLQQGDVLIIDSSHVAKIGSDVVYEYLEILPRLAVGVYVHIHDIFFPMNYPRKWIMENRFFWNEQYLLQAFLLFNKDFEVIMPSYALSQKFPEKIVKYIPSKDKPDLGLISSFWLKRVKG